MEAEDRELRAMLTLTTQLSSPAAETIVAWMLDTVNIILHSGLEEAKTNKKIAHTHNSICCFDKCLKYNKTYNKISYGFEDLHL